MNAFFKEIAALTELPFDTAFSTFRYINIGSRALYVQGHKGVISFDTERIVLRVQKSRLEIIGNRLSVKQLSSDDAVVTGDIVSVTAE